MMKENFWKPEEFLAYLSEDTEIKQPQRLKYEINPNDFLSNESKKSRITIQHDQLAKKTVVILNILCTKGFLFLGRKINFSKEDKVLIKEALAKEPSERSEEEMELLEKLEAYSDLEDDFSLNKEEQKQLETAFAEWYQTFSMSRMSPGWALVLTLLMILGSRFFVILNFKLEQQ